MNRLKQEKEKRALPLEWKKNKVSKQKTALVNV
jgi:hypothetical protein